MAERAGPGFGRLLRLLRDEAGLTQEELAGAAQVSQRAVSDLERGINRTARKDTALLLAGALGLDGQARDLFIAAARGRGPAAEVLAAWEGLMPGTLAAAATRALPRDISGVTGRDPELARLMEAVAIAAARGKATPAAPGNLPAELTTFIGRDREVSEVVALLRSSRLVTLTGAGGVGKTRLGLRVAAEFPGEAEDGIYLVELAETTGDDQVEAAVARVLRIPPQPGRPMLDVLADALAPQQMLAVLDNCEHLIDSCAKTTDTLLRRCPKLTLIATSREPLGIAGETVYRVPPLSLPPDGDDSEAAARSSDAAGLLADRARSQDVSIVIDARTGPLLVSLSRRLDGMPLAIELAAARLRTMSLRELSDRLDQRFRLLTGGSRAGPARHRTLEAAIGWSYSLLTGAEQIMLGRLTVFAGGFDLAAAEAVCGLGTIEPLEVAGVLGSLVDKSLVCAEPVGEMVRYRLLETIRMFAADRLAEAGPEEAPAAEEAHCAHYLAVAEQAAAHLHTRDAGSWLARLDGDQANIRRGAQHAASCPDSSAQVLRFGLAMRNYWGARYRTKEAADLLVPALARPEAGRDRALFTQALAAAAELVVFVDRTTGRGLAEKAAGLARELGDERLIIRSLSALCYTYFFVGELDRARPPGQEAVERARTFGDDVLLGLSLYAYVLAIDAAPGSSPLYAEAIACSERTGDLRINAHLHNEAGLAALQRGEIASAKAHLEAGIRAANEMGGSHPAGFISLGMVFRAERDFYGARSAFQHSLRTCRRIGNKAGIAYAILGLACLSADLGDFHRAAALHGAAQAILDQTGLPWRPFISRFRQQSFDQIDTALGHQPRQRDYSEGQALSIGQALDLALSES